MLARSCLRVAALQRAQVYGRRGFSTTLPLLARRSATVVTGVIVAPPPTAVSPVGTDDSTAVEALLLKRSIASTPQGAKERIEKAIKKSPVVLFMKGYPEQPMCGYSRAVVLILNREGVKFDSYNVLEDEGLRQGIKDYTGWQTIPQLFINGEFVGGADITQEMYKNGDLRKALETAGAVKPVTA